MSKKNGYGSSTMVVASMFLSPAFLSLGHRGTAEVVSACSVQFLILLLGKRQFSKKDRKGSKSRQCLNCKALTLTYKELEARGISQQRATRCIDELLAKGFIEIIHQGGCYDKDKTVFGLVDDYLRWRPGHIPMRARERRDVLRGFQGKAKKQKQHTLTVVRDTCADSGQVAPRHAR
jgi:hypothetical protein